MTPLMTASYYWVTCISAQDYDFYYNLDSDSMTSEIQPLVTQSVSFYGRVLHHQKGIVSYSLQVIITLDSPAKTNKTRYLQHEQLDQLLL